MHLLAGGYDGSSRLWNISETRIVCDFQAPYPGFTCVALSPDGKKAISGTLETAWLWDTATGETINILEGHGLGITYAAFSADGTTILTCDASFEVRVWDTATGNVLRVLDKNSAAAISSDRKKVLLGRADGSVKICDLVTGNKRTLFAPLGEPNYRFNAIRHVGFSPDGMQAVFISPSDRKDVNQLHLYKLTTETLMKDSENLQESTCAAVFIDDGKRLATFCRCGSMRLWKTRPELFTDYPPHDCGWPKSDTETRLLNIRLHHDINNCCAVRPKQPNVIAVVDSSAVVLWDTLTEKQLTLLNGYTTSVHSVMWSPDGTHVLAKMAKRIATLAADTGDELDETPTSQLLGLKDMGEPFSIQFSPDGSKIVARCPDATAQLFELDTGAMVQTFSGHTSGITSVVFSPDGTKILTGSYDGTARIWNTETGKELGVLTGHKDGVSAVAFSPDGAKALTGSHDGTVRMWEL
jgi:WD40 repeat protein